MAFQAEIIELDTVPCHPQAEALKQAITEKYKNRKKHKYVPNYEWQSLSLLLQETAPDDKVLEIICAHHTVTNMLTRIKNYIRKTKTPRRLTLSHKSTTHEKATPEQFMEMSKKYDVIISVQALEYLSEKRLVQLLEKMRTSCNKKLLLLVPYMQALPLPAEHKQQFNEARMTKLFPNANFRILLKNPITRGPWLMIEEAL